MEFLTIILAAIILVALAVAGLAIQIIFKKKGSFPNSHIGSNKNMKSMGITCVQTMDKIEQRKARTNLYEGLKLNS